LRSGVVGLNRFQPKLIMWIHAFYTMLALQDLIASVGGAV